MAKIAALTPDELHAHGSEFTADVLTAVRQVLRTVRGNLGGKVTLDDLAVIPTLWAAKVNDVLLPLAAAQYQRGVDTVHSGASQLVRDALTAAAPAPAEPPPVGTIDEALPMDVPFKPGPLTVAKVSNTVAEKYLAGAGNRLVNVGNEVWEVARSTLLEGFLSGEGIAELASRLGMVPETYAARAEVIARTEVQSASNVGATDQIKAIDVPAEKTWMATMDERTRPAHADADGQTVPVDEPYDVDGESLDCPGDPGGSAGNVINCRCTQEFNIPDDQVGDMGADSGEGDPIDNTALDSLVAQADDGGFTYDPITDASPDGGYSVSPYPERSSVIETADLTPDHIQQYAHDNADLLSQPDHHLGAWRDTSEGQDRVWLDVSIVHADQATAENTAQQFDQKAIFDLNSGTVIQTGGTGGQAGLTGGATQAVHGEADEDRQDHIAQHRRSASGADRGSATGTRAGHASDSSEQQSAADAAGAAPTADPAASQGLTRTIYVAHDPLAVSLTATIEGANGNGIMTGTLSQQTDLGGKPNKGTKPDKRLKENDLAEADAEHFGTSKSISEAPWDGSAGRFSDEQYQNAAAACDPASSGTVKERCFLPHHEPGGATSRAGVHAAAGRVSSLSGHSADAVATAKAHLRSHYSQLKEEPPDSLGSSGETESFASETAADSPQWRGGLTVEGKPTGDQREFAPNSLTWVEGDDKAPMILQWQKESSHGGDHDVTVAVGRIDRVWRDGAVIMGEGRFDTHPDAVEAHRRMAAGMLNGTSINADDITDTDVEYIYPEGDAEQSDDDEGDWIELLFAKPEKIVFHAGRIRATTLCDIPAFVEATLSVVDGSAAPVSSALDTSHSTATESGAWDGAAAEARLPDEMTGETALAAYALVALDDNPDDDEEAEAKRRKQAKVAKTDSRFLHHEISDDGVPGAANLSACSSGIGLLHDTQISDSDKQGIYNHLARHLRDGGQEVPPFEARHSLVAHAWQDTFRPPAAWFADPKLTVATPIIVTDHGRVYGLATEWSECHLGYMNECILPPRNDDFTRFMTGEQPLDDGSTVAVGVITAGIGHAPMSYGANRAAEHYDNTDAIIAYVTVGNCKLGIWVAGAVLPWAQEARVSALRATGQVSPDWRRIGGQLRMVGLLTVNISGYQVGKPSVRTFTASAGIQTLIASGITSVRRPAESTTDLDQRALRLLSDRIAKRVHPEGV